jgi:mannose-1-phosphate guanylyltransferase
VRTLLLAAGMGTRLRPLTDSVPKCLVPIAGRALLDYWLDHLFSRGTVQRALINTHHLASQVQDHASRSPWAARVDLAYEAHLLGTAGTIRANRGYFGEESFLVAHADNLTTCDIAGFVAAHEARPPHCAMTMLTFRAHDPRSCGIVALDWEGVVAQFYEKVENPPGDLANAAVYMLTQEVADFIARSDEQVTDFSTQILPSFVGRIFAVECRGYHRDIGTIESLRLANEDASRLFR